MLNFSADRLERYWDWCNFPVDVFPGPNNTAEPFSPSIGRNIISEPEPLFQPLPPYTEEARKKRAEGVVVVQVIIRKDGVPDRMKVIRGLGYGLDESFIHTLAAKWRFLPAMMNGKPVEVFVNVEAVFRFY